MSDQAESGGARPRIVIAGGGIAGLETALALHHLAPGLGEVTVIASDPDFTYKPMVVEEPFTFTPAERLELAPMLKEIGMSFLPGAVTAVHPGDHEVELSDGERVGYDQLVVAVGGRATPALEGAETFWAASSELPIDDLIKRAAQHPSKTMAFVVPPTSGWPLPLYELALMTRRRAGERGFRDLAITVVTPEQSPLRVFGLPASEAVATLLDGRGIEVRTGARASDKEGGGLLLRPGDEPLEAGAVVALPEIEGPAVAGLPADDHGFIPIDEHARVRDVDDVYAAGDGTTFPIKQGGIGTQQADAAAEHIAADLGAPVDPQPFHPVLRGRLLTGDESLSLRHDVAGGEGEGAASLDYLWWPPSKVGGRYLAPFLGHTTPDEGLEPPSHPLEVEVSLPTEWHSEPMQRGWLDE